jgi:hypothetical protein
VSPAGGGGGGDAAHQQQHANHGKREAEDHQPDWNKPLVALLASQRAVRDQQEQPEKGRRQNPDEDERDPEEDSPDRFQGLATNWSLRRLDIDDEPGWITELEGANAGRLG